MDLFSWTDDLSVKVGKIDNQHKELIKLINKLNSAMAAGKGKDTLGEIIAGLADYTAYHFATEEDYFDQYGYEESTQHKIEHRYFIDTISEFRKAVESGQSPLPMESMGFLKDWVIDHIKGSDQMYVECFLRQMVV